MRYERKFLTHHMAYDQTEAFLISNTVRMHEIYEKRHVNNLYFDTHDFQFYHANLTGEEQRLKVRIRWYGDFAKIEEPVLEFKIRRGLMISKKTYPVSFENVFDLDSSKLMEQMVSKIDDPQVTEQMKYLQPALLNRYYRGYYLTFDGSVRATIDEDVEFYSPDNLCLFFKERARLIELKYPPIAEKVANKLSNTMPFRLTRNSKYVNGLNKLLCFST